jgi:hypothetical protein
MKADKVFQFSWRTVKAAHDRSSEYTRKSNMGVYSVQVLSIRSRLH